MKIHVTTVFLSALGLSLIPYVSSSMTLRGRQRVLARQRRAVGRWSQPVYTPAGYSPPSPRYSQNGLQNLQQQSAQQSLYSNPAASPYNQQYSSYPTNAASFQQYTAPVKSNAYGAMNQGAMNQAAMSQMTQGVMNQRAMNQGAMNQPYSGYPVSAGGVGTSRPAMGGAPAGYGTQATNSPYYYSGYPQGNMVGSAYNMQGAGSGYQNYAAKNNFQSATGAENAYPKVESSFAKNQYAQPGSSQYVQQNYGLYQDPLRTPMQYNFNGFDPNRQQQGSSNGQQGNQAGFNQMQGIGRAAVSQPLVTPAPQQTAQQYNLAEFCLKPDREPKCKKNSFSMCDYQDNYPTEAASEFYAYYKSRITAMTTDYDYSSSDEYDTGFATQQNKLIDFVHDIFDDNEYGNLPGVPPQKKGLCIGVSDIFQPGWAKTSHGKFYVIMNSNNIKQTIRAEVCKNVGKGCQTVPKCYKSECRQRYRYDTLLALDPCDPKRAPMLELFKIPDGCECIVIVDEPDESDSAASPTPGPMKQRNILPTSAAMTASPRSADFPAPTASPTKVTTVGTTATTAATTTTTSQTTTSTSTVTLPTTQSSTQATSTSTVPATTSKDPLILSPR